MIIILTGRIPIDGSGPELFLIKHLLDKERFRLIIVSKVRIPRYILLKLNSHQIFISKSDSITMGSISDEKIQETFQEDIHDETPESAIYRKKEAKHVWKLDLLHCTSHNASHADQLSGSRKR